MKNLVLSLLILIFCYTQSFCQKYTKGTLHSIITYEQVDNELDSINKSPSNKIETETFFDEKRISAVTKDFGFAETTIRVVNHKDSAYYYVFQNTTDPPTFEKNLKSETINNLVNSENFGNQKTDSIVKADSLFNLMCYKVFFNSKTRSGWMILTPDIKMFNMIELENIEIIDTNFLLAFEFYDKELSMNIKYTTTKFLPEIKDTSVFDLSLQDYYSMESIFGTDEDTDLIQKYYLYNAKNSTLLKDLFKEGLIDGYDFEIYAKNNYDLELVNIIEMIVNKAPQLDVFNHKKLKTIFEKYHLLQGTVDTVFRMESFMKEDMFYELVPAIKFAAIKDFYLHPDHKRTFIKNAIQHGYLQMDDSLINKFLNNEIGYSEVFNEFNNLIPLDIIDTLDNKEIIQSMVNFLQKAFNYNLPHVKVSFDDSLVYIQDRNWTHNISVEEVKRRRPNIPDFHFTSDSTNPLSPSVKIYQNLLRIVNQLAVDNNLEYKSKIFTSWKLMNENAVFYDMLLLNMPFLQTTNNKIYLSKNISSVTNQNIYLSNSPEHKVYTNQPNKLVFYKDRVKDVLGQSPLTTEKKFQLLKFLKKYQNELGINVDQMQQIEIYLQKTYINYLSDFIVSSAFSELNIFQSDFELIYNETINLESGGEYSLSEIYPNLYSFMNDDLGISDIKYDSKNNKLVFKWKNKKYNLDDSSKTILDFIVENRITSKHGKQLLRHEDYFIFMRPELFEELKKIVEE